ncbi:flagellin [Clostridium mediterraneense]|uniref:flagellin N-terminal helical domain-containing protein n=1 Tax=Clostridium mediterraneense TaxID=1805472 RepID=UPI00082FB8B1|nr:flagellin [Clostridium mediterraneense]
MIINHNLNAMNAHRQMGINTTNQGKAIEKLSSGQRINRAGDDAAGLAISEKMRGQIRGLEGASRNAQDGISMIQTAEGALNETHNMLQRMRELAVQGANDTNTAEDRTKIQEEMNQLMTEIDRISTDTEFNKQKLLDGSFSGKLQIGANGGQNVGLDIDKLNSSSLGLTTTTKIDDTVTLKADSNLKDGTYTVSENGANLLDSKGNTVGTINAGTLTVNGVATDFETSTLKAGSELTVKNNIATVKNELGASAKDLASGNYEISGTNVLKDGELIGTLKVDPTNGNSIELKDSGKVVKEADLGFEKGKLADGSKFTIGGVDVSNHSKASGAIETINSAIETVSEARGKLGAMQNRLEHTIATNDNSAENLQAAESRIRDVDMAKEMMNLSKNNVLVQAAQSMLAQANQQPQGVLSLLR